MGQRWHGSMISSWCRVVEWGLICSPRCPILYGGRGRRWLGSAGAQGWDTVWLDYYHGSARTICDWVLSPPRRCGDEARSNDEDLDGGCECNKMNEGGSNQRIWAIVVKGWHGRHKEVCDLLLWPTLEWWWERQINGTCCLNKGIVSEDRDWPPEVTQCESNVLCPRSDLELVIPCRRIQRVKLVFFY
jgi:hypothetical protein